MTELSNSLVDAVHSAVQAAAQQREVVLWGAIAFAAVVLIQAFLTLWALRRLRELDRMRERMSRLADGLALLTDTTESGLTTLSRQVDQLLRRPAPAAPRASSRPHVAKRVVAAAKQGSHATAIARDEELSESEVRLHLALAGGERVSGSTSNSQLGTQNSEPFSS